MNTISNENPASSVNTNGRLFRRVDWSAFWTAFVVVFAFYFYTLAPTVTLEDSGELATGGAFLGVPHPPGYPLWSMLSWVFAKALSFVHYLGQPNPAYAIGLGGSALFGALAAAISALLISRSSRDLLSGITADTSWSISESTQTLVAWCGGIAGSLLFAFSPANWSQSVIVEVYSLNAFFMALILLLAYMWMKRPSDKILIWLSFVFGLGLTNYQALLLMLPALIIVIILRDLKLFRDFVIAAIPFGIVLFLMNKGIIPDVIHPTNSTGFIYVLLNFAALILIYFTLPHGKVIALSILAVEAGLAVYGYMPLSSETNPPMNWGYPRTWEGFKHAITRGQYEKIEPTNIFTPSFLAQIFDYFNDLRVQFTLIVAIFGFIPFTAWQIRVGNKPVKALYVTLGLVVTACGLILAEELLVPTGTEIKVLTTVYHLLIAAILGMLVFGLAIYMVMEFRELFLKLIGKVKADFSERLMAALVYLGVAGLYAFFIRGMWMAIQMNTAMAELPGAEAGSHLYANFLLVLAMILPAAVVAFVVWLMHSSLELKTNVDTQSRKWLLVTVFSFLVMSIMFMVLANPKGDLQDAFIQRVKFISSHAVFSFWIGYGVVLGVAFIEMLFRGQLLIKALSTVAVLALPLIPLYENWTNTRQIREIGGSEMNGHDFGWQFGNYQLRGAEAIHEELHPDEEPLPNPTFPPEMGEGAIFYGGTDPGRFVPTYMIYSAKVREDVYLITQNALADTTYMSVMRDLYGDRIWIPSQTDSAEAFRIYIDEVQAGKRQPNADLKIEGGRVQVSGALGVMEINGILADMIFKRNRWRHPFYVEESYVIRWMYPYLEPHGLIMKINPEPILMSSSDKRVRNDSDFWDWYTRRLQADRKFTRDVVARKSFSKLRSAIAGIYAYRGMYPEAEDAFQQARLLYPLSPEANFRLAQEVYVPQMRFRESLEMLGQFHLLDPKNKAVEGFTNQLERLDNTMHRIASLENMVASGQAPVDSVLELAELYASLGQTAKFNALAMPLVDNTNLSPVACFQLARLFQRAGNASATLSMADRFTASMPEGVPANVYLELFSMYAQSGRLEKAYEYLKRYLGMNPADWERWLDLSYMEIILNKPGDAVKSANRALMGGGERAAQIIATEPRFQPIRQRVLEMQNTMGGGFGGGNLPNLPIR